MKWCTDFLFAQPSFLYGVARSVDVWGLFDRYNMSDTIEEADARAFGSDFYVTGDDLRRAMLSYDAMLSSPAAPAEGRKGDYLTSANAAR